MIICKRLQKDKNTCIVFIEFEKVFNRVEWNKFFSMLKNSSKGRGIIRSLYKNQSVVIKSGETQKEAKFKELIKIGIKFDNKKIDMLRCADNMAELAEIKKELEEFFETMKKNIKINLDVNNFQLLSFIHNVNSAPSIMKAFQVSF